MSQPTKPGERRQEIDALANEVARANTHFHFFKKLQENYHQLAGAKDFWDYTLAAHLGVTLLQMARVYDTSKDGLNLKRLLGGVDKKLMDKAGRQQLASHTGHCDRQEPLVAKIRTWRNNIIAHYNRGVALAPRDNFWNRYPLEHSEIQELIDRAFRILEWCAQIDGQAKQFQKLAEGKDGYLMVLDCLRIGSPEAMV